MALVKKDKKVKYTIELNQEEAEAVAIALDHLNDRMRTGDMIKFRKPIARPGISDAISITADRDHVQNVLNHLAYTIEED